MFWHDVTNDVTTVMQEDVTAGLYYLLKDSNF